MNERAKILIVDDEPFNVDYLEQELEDLNYDTISASNGQEALERIAVQLPALVITDILMPKMDGFSFVQKLRTDSKTMQIPVIFLSATYVTPEDKKFALNLGAVRFLEKPVDTEDFLLTIAEVLTTGGGSAIPAPMSETDFFAGYRDRLEQKLRHKNTQIARTERLLQTLPDEQKPAFESLLNQAISDHDEIQAELNQLYKLLGEIDAGAPVP